MQPCPALSRRRHIHRDELVLIKEPEPENYPHRAQHVIALYSRRERQADLSLTPLPGTYGSSARCPLSEASATTAAAGCAFLRCIDSQTSTIEFLVVHLVASSRGSTFVIEGDETKSTRSASLSVQDNGYLAQCPKAFESATKTGVVGCPCKTTYKQFF